MGRSIKTIGKLILEEGFALRRDMKKLINDFGILVCKLAAMVWNYGVLRYSIYEVDWRDISKGKLNQILYVINLNN